MTGARQVVLALGSNLGDRLANLQAGIDVLLASPSPRQGEHSPRQGEHSPRQGEQGLTATAVSGVYQTKPVGGPPQPDYLNAVLLAVSALPARSILDRCQAAERASRRVRTVRWGPRTLDIDIIACGTEVSDDPELTLPHPRASQRAFVLVPWLQADPDASLPGFGPVAELLGPLRGAGSAGGAHGVTLLPDVKLRVKIGGSIDRCDATSRG